MLSGRDLSTFQGNLLSGSFKSSGVLHCVVGLVVFRVFDSGDEETAILRNVENYFPKTWRHIPEVSNFEQYRCQNLKSRNKISSLSGHKKVNPQELF